MLPSRGLRWSSQTIGFGRRRIESLSVRNFSSSRSLKASPLLTQQSAPFARTNATFQASWPGLLLRHGAGVRFASTSPAAPIVSPTSAPATAPIDVVSSSAASPSNVSLDNVVEFTSQSLLDIPEQIGYLKSLGLDYGYGPTAGMEWLLEHVHILAGTPWWVSITLTALVVRAVLFKPYMGAADNGARLATIMHLTKPIQKKMQAAAAAGDTTLTMELRGELQRINAKAGIKLWKSFVPMVQIFAGYGTFILLRAMSNLPVPGLETGGALWFYNLAIPDPYFILPMATATVLHWVLRRGGEMGVNTMDPKMQKGLMWGLPMLTVIFTWWLPAALQLSFFFSGLLSYGQATLFRQSWFRNYFNMLPLPTKASATPSAPSPYKGTIKRALPPGPLSSSELGNRFEGPKGGLQKTVGKIKEMQPPTKRTGIFTAPISGIKDTVASIKDSGKGMVDMAKERMEKSNQKSIVKERKIYEAKRQEQLKKERWEKENEQRAERAARRAMKNREE